VLYRKTDPTLVEEKTHNSKHVHVQEGTKILVVDLQEAEATNQCASETSSNFNYLPTGVNLTLTVHCSRMV
jgi:hypothetical protein